jgi:hypothetical protein
MKEMTHAGPFTLLPFENNGRIITKLFQGYTRIATAIYPFLWLASIEVYSHRLQADFCLLVSLDQRRLGAIYFKLLFNLRHIGRKKCWSLRPSILDFNKPKATLRLHNWWGVLREVVSKKWYQGKNDASRSNKALAISNKLGCVFVPKAFCAEWCSTTLSMRPRCDDDQPLLCGAITKNCFIHQLVQTGLANEPLTHGRGELGGTI